MYTVHGIYLPPGLQGGVVHVHEADVPSSQISDAFRPKMKNELN